MALSGLARVWGRILCIVISAASLTFVFSRLELERLVQTIHSADLGWYAVAVLTYGSLFLPAARRWHLVLRLTGQAVNARATVRATLIGHFFYLLFFGAVGGDTVKSGWYARRFGLSLPAVLATAPVDRLLGLAGLLVLGSAMIVVAVASGTLETIRAVPLRWPRFWAAGIVLLIALIVLIVRRSGPDSFPRRFLASLSQNGRAVLRNPRITAQGIVCGILVQALLSGTLALNVQAVSQGPIAWLQLAWTFPVIALMGALPITVAGLGTRETAALGLLAIYGIPAEQAVAASLLTMSANLLWAVAGGLVLWRETYLEKEVKSETRPATPRSCG